MYRHEGFEERQNRQNIDPKAVKSATFGVKFTYRYFDFDVSSKVLLVLRNTHGTSNFLAAKLTPFLCRRFISKLRLLEAALNATFGSSRVFVPAGMDHSEQCFYTSPFVFTGAETGLPGIARHLNASILVENRLLVSFFCYSELRLRVY